MQLQTDNQPITPQQKEARAMRTNATFVGVVLIAMIVVQQLVQMASYFGWLQVFSPFIRIYEGYMLFNMIVYIVVLAVPTLLVALLFRRHQNPFPSKRVCFRTFSGSVLAGMALAIVSNFLASWLMQGMSALGVPEPEMPDRLQPTLLGLALNLLSTAILPALIEEMVFRGYILGALRPHGDWVAVILSAVLFGLFHGNVLQAPFAFILGIVLGYLVVLTDSIWPSVVLHFANNAMSVLLSFFAKLNPRYAGVTTTVTFAVVAAIGAVVIAVVRFDRSLKPIGNGASCFRVSARIGKLLSAPAMILAILAILTTIGFSIRSGLV